MKKEEYIMKFIYQKIQEGYEVKRIKNNTYEFKIASSIFNDNIFFNLEILPFVKEHKILRAGNGIKILN